MSAKKAGVTTEPEKTAAVVAPLPDGLVRGDDGVLRCWWCAGDREYERYHDEEWGRPQHDDRLLLEKLCLEGFQAGLSWLTILRKRPAFREAFCGFDPHEVARFGAVEIRRLLGNAGIVRHRGKIEAAIGNAKATLQVIADEGSLDAFIWSFAPPADQSPRTKKHLCANTQTAASLALSRALRKRGFRFVGPTTMHAFMQSVGMVLDHVEGCHVLGPASSCRSPGSASSCRAARTDPRAS